MKLQAAPRPGHVPGPRRARRLVLPLSALALVLAGCGSQGVPDVSVQVGSGQATSGGSQFAVSLQLLVAMTVLAFVPTVLMLATSFTRIVVVLSLLRTAIGIPQLPPNQVLLGLGLFLTLFTMAPVWSKVNDQAIQPFLANSITQDVALERGMQPIRDFMLRETRESELKLFVDLSNGPRPEKPEDIRTEALMPAFLVSELKTAFEMGFLLFIPFLVIDLVIASALMSMGMVMVSPVQISLPFKLLLFVLVDGWSLIVQSLVRSFA